MNSVEIFDFFYNSSITEDSQNWISKAFIEVMKQNSDRVIPNSKFMHPWPNKDELNIKSPIRQQFFNRPK